MNTGLTYSNFEHRRTVMVIAMTTSPEQFQNSWDHEKGLSQYNIWKQGMNFGTVNAIESGKNVNLKNFLKYCEIVGIDVTLEEKE